MTAWGWNRARLMCFARGTQTAPERKGERGPEKVTSAFLSLARPIFLHRASRAVGGRDGLRHLGAPLRPLLS